MITTEEAERLAELHEHDAARFVSGMPGREFRQHTATAIRFLAAERDALQAEVERLKAGGCARDQSTTQFCAEAVALQAENARLFVALKVLLTPQTPAAFAQAIANARVALGEKE
jgi:hypothetical protein